MANRLLEWLDTVCLAAEGLIFSEDARMLDGEQSDCAESRGDDEGIECGPLNDIPAVEDTMAANENGILRQRKLDW
eukprot:CAMPEP_0113663872 /NCGR_PEP_ID=MMETSP0038_2-20120614/1405_1 /TAXON_ID=2898 /ORGANISM="Cryptomonas paramecium" /LENGTH=75 /DNA_ID=CAMNT_0000578991 /DNA_START=36 /DNA_END=260 /DNA_ORIENTATION=+ /assembly_acc=CAM_ASM_000170